MSEKYCTGCLYKKDISEFNKRKLSSDGKSGICKSCVKISNAKSEAKNKKISDKAAKNRAECRAEDKIKVERVVEKKKAFLTIAEKERIKKIMSVPVNFMKTQFFYMPLSSKYNAKTSRIR